MPYGFAPSTDGIAGILARALARLNFPQLSSAGDAIRPGIEQGILEPGMRAIQGIQGVGEGLEGALDYGSQGRFGKATIDAFVRPPLNIAKTLIPGTGENEAFAEDAWSIARPIGQAIVNPQGPSVWDETQMSQGPSPMADQVGPQSMGIEPYPEQPMTLGAEGMEQVPWVMDGQGAPSPQEASAQQPGAYGNLLGDGRDYDAETERWKQAQLGQWLMRAGAGMGSAPLGDVAGGIARAGAGVADFMASQPSEEQYKASLQDQGMKRTIGHIELATALEDLQHPSSKAVLRAFVAGLPPDQQGKAALLLATGKVDQLLQMAGAYEGEITTKTVNGVTMNVRTGTDGVPEFQMPGTEEWRKMSDEDFQSASTEAYKQSPGAIATAAGKEYGQANKGGDSFQDMMEGNSGGKVSYTDIFDEQARMRHTEFREAPPEQQQQGIEEFKSNPQNIEVLASFIHRQPTDDDIAMYLAGNLSGLGIGE